MQVILTIPKELEDDWKADTKTNTMRTAVLNGLGLNVTVAVGQQEPIAMNIK